MISRKYFGTDGIRGKVGKFPIVPDFILKLGWAAGKILSQRSGSKKIIIGKDTRISGYMLESALGSGMSAAGISTIFTGPIPTPAISYLTKNLQAEAGIVISASHNSFNDNGIKFFSFDGSKLSDEVETAIEQQMMKPIKCVECKKLGISSFIKDASGYYIKFCKSTFPSEINLNKLKIVVDCANGSTYNIVPNVLSELGAEVYCIANTPNGININNNCGAMNVSCLRKMVLETQADIGLAFDGDGDRVIMVDHRGNKIDGDQIVYVLAKEMLRTDQLQGGGIIGTFMSNSGLEIALQQLGVPFIRTQIGDRYVLASMKKHNWKIGAENSGHIILLDKTTTGDGIIASLQVLKSMIYNNMSLYELCSNMKLLPQVVINVPIDHNNINLLDYNSIKKLIYNIEQDLYKKGRVIVRQSGTEPVIRIMVEGHDSDQVLSSANYIAEVVKKELQSIS